MATKWAHYCISAVRNDSRGVIQKVKTHPDNGDSIGSGSEEARQQVIANIKAGYTYVTIFMKDGKWRLGQPVYIILVNGTEFIKTTNNGQAVDNLDDLPAF